MGGLRCGLRNWRAGQRADAKPNSYFSSTLITMRSAVALRISLIYVGGVRAFFGLGHVAFIWVHATSSMLLFFEHPHAFR